MPARAPQLNLQFSRRLRRTPYTEKVEALGVSGFSVVNHMLLPKSFTTSTEDDYWHLREAVQLWDVSCQRQVEIRGVDAARLVQWMTCRDLTAAQVGDCCYAPLINHDAGLINDPVVLKLADDHFYLSVADSDVLLWAAGLAHGAQLRVQVTEPDVSPLAVQGARARELMKNVFGAGIDALGFFRFSWFEFMGRKQLVARSGYSSQDGFEIYLHGSEFGDQLWDALWEAGSGFGVRPGAPNLIDRIEAGLLSYGNDMTRENNPLECGLEKFCALNGKIDYIGKAALRQIAQHGITQQLRGVVFDGDPCPACAAAWQVLSPTRNQVMGQVTSAAYSPRFNANVGIAMLRLDASGEGTAVRVQSADRVTRSGWVTALPFQLAH